MKITRLLHSHRKLRITQEQRAKNLSELSGIPFLECLERLRNPNEQNFQWEYDLVVNASKKAGNNLIQLLQQQTLETVQRRVSK